jgi:hypothetical protein
MDTAGLSLKEYCSRAVHWADGWAVVADPDKFAAKFNSLVSGAYRTVSGDDIRQMLHCGLIGRHGFFDREDLYRIRGILLYEKMREHSITRSNACVPSEITRGQPELPD